MYKVTGGKLEQSIKQLRKKTMWKSVWRQIINIESIKGLCTAGYTCNTPTV